MKKLDRELENLKERVAKMGDTAQVMVNEAVLALVDPRDDAHYHARQHSQRGGQEHDRRHQLQAQHHQS